ncbi:MAG TPA: helix-turn-helix transcriptional regulator [Thermoguttaceae bacterium]|nr:helix-turn-helix transcriptional regulator [Thermoguttaceae bacterium]
MPKIALDGITEDIKMTEDDGEWIMDLGDRIRTARKKAGLSQMEVWTQIGIYPSMLSRIESGKQEPTLSTLRRLAELLGVDLGALLASKR